MKNTTQYWWNEEKKSMVLAQENDFHSIQNIQSFSYGEHEAQQLDVYYPLNSNGHIFFLIHGGAWMIGDKKEKNFIVSKVNYFCSLGYTVVSTNYRLFPQYTLFEQLEDIYNAYSFIEKKYPSFNLNILGYSSGAHMGLLMLFSYNIRYPKNFLSIDCPFYCLKERMKRKHPYFLDYVFTQEKKWQSLSPTSLIKNILSKISLITSTQNQEHILQSEYFSEKMIEHSNFVNHLKKNFNHKEIDIFIGNDLIYSQQLISLLNH